jgi:hypothetical protein
MVIEYDISPQFVPIPPDEAEQEIHDLVEEELSFVYKKGKPSYRVEIAEAKHMTFSDLVILQAWADAGRCFGTEDPLDAARTLEVMRDYVREFFDKFLPGRPPARFWIDPPGNTLFQPFSTQLLAEGHLSSGCSFDVDSALLVTNSHDSGY